MNRSSANAEGSSSNRPDRDCSARDRRGIARPHSLTPCWRLPVNVRPHGKRCGSSLRGQNHARNTAAGSVSSRLCNGFLSELDINPSAEARGEEGT